MKKLLATIGIWLALTTGALAACPVGWTGLGSCNTLLNKLTNADVNAALGATITLGSSKTFTVSNTLTFTGTDSTSFAFPSASGTVATLAATQTLANKTLTSPTINGGALSGTLTGTPTFSGNLTFSGVPLFTGLSAGTVVKYVGLDSGNNAVLGTPAGGSFANPSATAGPSAVNGSATTAMRSDAAPAVQKGTNAQFGIIEGDGSTITCVLGVCSAIGGAATSIVVGTTTIGSGTTGHIEYDNGGVLGELATGTATNQVVLGGAITAGGPTGSATVAPIVTYNAAGQLTAVSSATITPAVGSITGLGTGVASALADNIGSAGAPVVFNGALGTPSSGTGTNITGIPAANILAGTLANPMLATTQSTGDNSTKVATTAYVQANSVQSVGTGNGLTGGPITTTGTIAPTFYQTEVTSSCAVLTTSSGCTGNSGGDMAYGVMLGGSGATLTLSAKTTGLWQPGQTFGVTVDPAATGNWTLTNSSTLTLRGLYNSTTLFPGESHHLRRGCGRIASRRFGGAAAGHIGAGHSARDRRQLHDGEHGPVRVLRHHVLNLPHTKPAGDHQLSALAADRRVGLRSGQRVELPHHRPERHRHDQRRQFVDPDSECQRQLHAAKDRRRGVASNRREHRPARIGCHPRVALGTFRKRRLDAEPAGIR